jgi:ABC-type nitrate/sulfonate/bicarbonate transport system substrate-binding protein
MIAIANAHERGLPFEIIAPSAMYLAKKPTTLLMVAAKSTLRAPKDLEGKTIGQIEIRAMTEAAVQAWLSKSGVDA